MSSSETHSAASNLFSCFCYLWTRYFAWALTTCTWPTWKLLCYLEQSESGRLGFHRWLALWHQPGQPLSTCFFTWQLNTWGTTPKGSVLPLCETVHLINTAGITEKVWTWTHIYPAIYPVKSPGTLILSRGLNHTGWHMSWDCLLILRWSFRKEGRGVIW